MPAMTDFSGFTMAALSEKGSILANPQKGDKAPSTLVYRPCSSWASNSEVCCFSSVLFSPTFCMPLDMLSISPLLTIYSVIALFCEAKSCPTSFNRSNFTDLGL